MSHNELFENDLVIVVLPVAGKFMARLDKVIRSTTQEDVHITKLRNQALYNTPEEARNAMLPFGIKYIKAGIRQ